MHSRGGEKHDPHAAGEQREERGNHESGGPESGAEAEAGEDLAGEPSAQGARNHAGEPSGKVGAGDVEQWIACGLEQGEQGGQVGGAHGCAY